MEVNGYKVEKKGNIIFCSNGEHISALTIERMYHAYHNFARFFDIEKKDIVPKKNIFGMVLTIDDIINLYYLI